MKEDTTEEEVKRLIEAERKYYTRFMDQSHDHLKVESARIDVVLMSTSLLAIFYIMKEAALPKDHFLCSAIIWSLLLFSLVAMVNLFFLILSSKGYRSHVTVLSNMITDLDLKVPKDTTADIILKRQTEQINKVDKYRGTKAWIIKNNLWIQFGLWVLALLLLMLHYIL